MMAVTGMTMSASADTWSLYYSTSGSIKTYDYANFAAPYSASITSFNDSCTTYSQTTATNGKVAFVYYHASCLTTSGTIDFVCSSNWYYFKLTTYHNVPLDLNYVPANRVMRVSHYLDGNGRNCSFSGAVAR